jgi:hypothetical protein
MSIQMVNNGKTDERLEFVMSQTKTAVTTFVEAIKNSTAEQVVISFCAFTLNATQEESNKVFDLVMSIVAIELHSQAPELTRFYTFFHSVEEEVEVSECMTGASIYYKLLLHCDKTRKPPTKEEVELSLAKESGLKDELNAVEAVEEEEC